ncbi:hypothetical protein B0H13DRAFT_1926485 [Mycena leptocephala]|nr:hypothetical protein B0H13DRAFT_1926485 [Mycena leptocephala]
MSHDAASSSSAPPVAIPVASGWSLPIHPHHRDAGFQPGVRKGKEKYTYKDHRVSNEHIMDLIPTVQMQISELRDTVSDDQRELRQQGIAITEISARLLPALLRRIEKRQGPSTSLRPPSTLSLATVAPAPSAKRTRDEDVDDAARNTRPRTEIPQTVALSTTFVYTLVPPVATTTPLPVTTAPPAAPPAPPLAPSASVQAPPAAPKAPPRASDSNSLGPPAAPAASPRVHAIPQRQAASQVGPTLHVVFGPIAWNRDSQNCTNVQQDMLAIALPAAAHLEISSTRRYK